MTELGALEAGRAAHIPDSPCRLRDQRIAALLQLSLAGAKRWILERASGSFTSFEAFSASMAATGGAAREASPAAPLNSRL